MSEWLVAIRDDFQALAVDSRRVHIYRRVSDSVEVITGFTDTGTAVVERFDSPVPDPPGFLLPAEALEALGEVLKPGPSQGEVRRLEDALTLERRRVDDVLATIRTGGAE